jgi:hypothetical protein
MKERLTRLPVGIAILWVLLASGCALEAPAFRWPPPPTPPVPLQVRDVIHLLQAGIGEDVVIERIREAGIAARPTAGEIGALRDSGASLQLLATMMSAVLLEPADRPPEPRVELQFYLWQPYPPFPGLVPIPGWLWLEGRGRSVPPPERLEP